MAKEPVDFAVGDDLSDMLGTPAAPRPLPTDAAFVRIRETVPVFTERCKACDGTGRWGRAGLQCFKCKGKATRAFKTSPEARAKAKTAKVEKAKKLEESFSALHPAEFVWIITKAASFAFAADMKEKLRKHGSLTEKQFAAVARMAAADKAREEARKATPPKAVAIDCARIAKAFATATENGLRRPRLLTAGLQFSKAPDNGKNPGSIYVKQGPQYLGRIIDGGFLSMPSATKEQIAKVIDVAKDPLAAAKAYGLETGICSCCGRTLTDPVSIADGIGPICSGRYGFTSFEPRKRSQRVAPEASIENSPSQEAVNINHGETTMAKSNEVRAARNVLEELIGEMPERSKTKMKAILEPTEKKPETKKQLFKKALKANDELNLKIAKKLKAAPEAKGKPEAKATNGAKVHRAKFDPSAKVRILKPNAEVIERLQSKFDVLKKAKTVGDWYEKCKAKKVKGVGIPFLYTMIEDGIAKIG